MDEPLNTISLLRNRVEAVIPLYDREDRELEGLREHALRLASLPSLPWQKARRLSQLLDAALSKVPHMLRLFNVAEERTTGWNAHFLARNAVLQFWCYVTPYLKATGGIVVIAGRDDVFRMQGKMRGEIVCPIIPQLAPGAPPQTYVGVYEAFVMGWVIKGVEPDFLRQQLFPEPLGIYGS